MVEKVVEVPEIEIQETVIKVPKITQIYIDTVLLNPRIIFEVEKPKLVWQVIEVVKWSR